MVLQKNFGELDGLDFKEEWPSLPKMARHVLAMANCGGGCVVMGVSQEADKSLTARGLSSVIDKADIQRGMQKFLPNFLEYHVLDFAYDTSAGSLAGRRFQVLLVTDDPHYLPFVCEAGSDSTRRCAIYIRRGTSSEEATNEELQKVLNRRIETGYSSSHELTLDEHLADLKVLYAQIRPSITHSRSEDILRAIVAATAIVGTTEQPNPAYPKEGYEPFVARMIRAKKAVIANVLKSRK
jgi:hypothetical protein